MSIRIIFTHTFRNDMATRHIYIKPAQADRIAALTARQPVVLSKLLRRGLDLALDEAEKHAPTGGTALPARLFTAGEGPVAPAPAAAPAAPILAEPEPAFAPAIRLDEFLGETLFDFGDLCRYMGIEPVAAYDDMSQPPAMINGRACIDINGVKEALSLADDPRLADRVREWAMDQEAK